MNMPCMLGNHLIKYASNILTNKPIAAILGTDAKNAVNIVGDPSYTSGVHM